MDFCAMTETPNATLDSYQRACLRSNYLDTSEFFSTFLHIFGCISIPVNLFGAYCILFKTPESMKSMKWSLLNVHFWTSFLDFTMSLLTVPYIMAPALAGYPLGLFNLISLGIAEQTYITLTIGTVVAASVVGIFKDRFFHLKNPSGFIRYTHVFILIFNYTMAILCFLPGYIMIPDQEEAMAFLKTRVSCIPEYVDQARLFNIAIQKRWILRPGATFIGLVTFQIFLFSYLCHRTLNNLINGTMSKQTKDLQKTFQKALVLQIIIPIFILLAPLLYIGISSELWYHNQAFNNFCLIIISSHGFFSTIVLVLIHVPYRKFTLGLIGSRRCPRSSSVQNSRKIFPVT